MPTLENCVFDSSVLRHYNPNASNHIQISINDPHDDFFTSLSGNKLLAFESGKMICIDHDLRLFWAHSKNKYMPRNKKGS